MTAATSMAGRRAVLRWGWRLFRREWRQQLLVLGLLTVAVAAATYFLAFAYNVAGDGRAEFGSADVRIRFEGGDPTATAVDIATARRTLGPVDVVTTRSVPLPGSVKSLPFRSADPDGAFTGSMLALLDGRYPTGADDVAVTDDVARSLDVGVGDALELDGGRWQVVGVVENPGDLDDEFVLVPPTGSGAPDPDAGVVDTVTLLAGGDLAQADAFREAMTVEGNVVRDTPADNRAPAALGTLALATVGMLLAALIAVSSFLVMAQRRLRQLGLLAAIGGTPKQVRLVTLVDGAIVGLAAALLGTVAGLAVWAATIPRVEDAAAHRIDGLSTPPWLVGATVLLAVVTAVGAAWWPARMSAGMPVQEALSRRPPPPRSTRRSAALAVGLIVVGVVCLGLSQGDRPVLVILGIAVTPIGTLLLAPFAVRALALGAARLPLAGRLAVRDLGRNQARSGAALAAIGLALGVPVAVVIVAGAERVDDTLGNLSSSQLLIRAGNRPEPFVLRDLTPAASDDLDGQVDRFVATLGGSDITVVPLEMAVDPNAVPEPGLVDAGEVQAMELGWRDAGADHSTGLVLYVATPEVFEQLGHDPASAGADGIFSFDTGGEFFYFTPSQDKRAASTFVTDVHRLADPGYSSLPRTFVGPGMSEANGWRRARAGWLVESGAALTDAQLADAREWAAGLGLAVESRDTQASLASLQTGATAAGMVLALGILALTVGLIRSETAGDLRTLSAAGASTTIRRTLTAATSGALALLGVVLGVAGAYLVMLGAYLDDLGDLLPVPVLHLTAIAVGVPVLAAATSWLLAGRQPTTIARQALD